jgi:hypothetical protein
MHMVESILRKDQRDQEDYVLSLLGIVSSLL